MATRFYFPASTPADISPSFDASWASTADAVRRKMVTTKGTSSIAAGSTINVAAGTYALDRQYVSEPLAAQTLNGTATIGGSLMVRELTSTADVDSTAISVFLVDGSGTYKGHLWGWNAYGTFGSEFTTAASHRNAILASTGAFDTATYGTFGGSASIAAGDRIVVEIGYAQASGTGTSPQATGKWGENASDLPANDETQTTDGAGWIEISQTLTFAATTHSGAAAMSMSLTETAAGRCIRAGASAMQMALTETANGTRQANGATAMQMALTETAAGVRVANGAAAMQAALTATAEGGAVRGGAAAFLAKMTMTAAGYIPAPPKVVARHYVKASPRPNEPLTASPKPRSFVHGSPRPTETTTASPRPVSIVKAHASP